MPRQTPKMKAYPIPMAAEPLQAGILGLCSSHQVLNEPRSMVHHALQMLFKQLFT